MKRLRVFDLCCPLFWIVIFYRQRPYGEPSLALNVFDERGKRGHWWFHVWQWEPIPDMQGGFAGPELNTEEA